MDLGAIPRIDRGLGNGNAPAESSGRAPVRSGAKPAEIGKFVTVSFNFHADTVLSVDLCPTVLLPVISSNADQFSKFFHKKRLATKFATKSSLYIPPHLNRVAIHYRMKY